MNPARIIGCRQIHEVHCYDNEYHYCNESKQHNLFLLPENQIGFVNRDQLNMMRALKMMWVLVFKKCFNLILKFIYINVFVQAHKRRITPVPTIQIRFRNGQKQIIVKTGIPGNINYPGNSQGPACIHNNLFANNISAPKICFSQSFTNNNTIWLIR